MTGERDGVQVFAEATVWVRPALSGYYFIENVPVVLGALVTWKEICSRSHSKPS